MTDQITTEAQESPATTATQAAPAGGGNGAPASGGDAAPSSPPASVADGGTLSGGGDNAGADSPSEASGGPDLASLREQLAGGDEGLLNKLGRMRSVEEIGKVLRDSMAAAQAKQQPLTLKDGATEKEVAAYRKAVGIPDEPKDYPVQFREGFEPSDVDTELLGSFKQRLHEKNVDPKAAAVAMDWYQDLSMQIEQDRDAAMANAAKETQAVLRGEYGAEFDGNMMAANELLRSHMGEEGRDSILAWRGADGVRLQDNPDFVRMLVNLGVDYYGANTIVSGDVETTAKSLDEKIAEGLAVKDSDSAKYYSADFQEHMAKLFAQKERLEARNRG